VKLLRQIPSFGPIRAALLVALMQTPHRFRTKRQFWAYIGLALKTYGSGEYRFVGGQLQRSRKALAIRGRNINHNHDLKISSRARRLGRLRTADLSRISTKLAWTEE
jgi:transposase